MLYLPSVRQFIMNRQEDKSKKSSQQHESCSFTPYFFQKELSVKLLTDSSSSEFFDKFKMPNYFLYTAFRVHDRPPVDQSESQEKSEKGRKNRGNYRKYSVAEKQQAVQMINDGVDAKDVSKKYGIPRRNLLRWKKDGCVRKEGGSKSFHSGIELQLYKKIDQKQISTQNEIRNQAKKLSKVVDFKASKGWFCKFSRRYNEWKKQKRQKDFKTQGRSTFEEGQLSLLPQVSCSIEQNQDTSQCQQSQSQKNS